jgi:hypothetical protein
MKRVRILGKDVTFNRALGVVHNGPASAHIVVWADGEYTCYMHIGEHPVMHTAKTPQAAINGAERKARKFIERAAKVFA